MAPEQLLGKKVDVRTDIFGFCVTLYEALYERLPFQGEGLAELMEAVTSGKLPPVEHEHEVSPRIHRILVRGLQPDPELRYPSMDALLLELADDVDAARRRVLIIAIMMLLCVAVTAVIFSARSTGDRAATCEAAAIELSSLYDSARRERISAKILGSSVSFAASTWERVAPRLDDYAEAWSSARVDACTAHLEGRQSPRLFDLRTACLDQRRAGFAALLDVFENTDDATIAKLAEAVLSLPRLEPCADTEALTAAIPPPEDAEVASAVQRLRERLAEVKAYESTGRYKQATGLLAPLQAEAEALEYPPVQIEVLLRRGILAMWQFKFEVAEEALSEALYLAIAEGHDPAAADALSRLLYVRSSEDPKTAFELRRLGDALIERISGHDEIIGTYYNNVGVLEKVTGEYDAAREAYRRSLEVKRGLYGERHLEVAYTLSNLGSVDGDVGLRESAINYYSAALVIFEETLGPQHFNTGALLSNLANAYARAGQWHEADRGYAAMEEVFAGSPEVWVHLGPHILPDHGDYHLSRHRLEEAERSYSRVLSLLESAPQDDVAPALRAHIGLAAIAVERSDWVDVSARLDAIDSILEDNKEDSPLWPDVLDLRGYLLGSSDLEEERLAAHTRAFELRRSSTGGGSPLRALAHIEFARHLLDLGRTTEAGEGLSKAREIVEAVLPVVSLERFSVERLEGRAALAEDDVSGAVRHHRFVSQRLREIRGDRDYDYALARLELAHALWRADPEDAESRELAAQVAAALDDERALLRGAPPELLMWLEERASR